MPRLHTTHPITAVTYSDGGAAAEVLRRVVGRLLAGGVRCCGFLQHDELCEGRSRCDMVLEDLSSRQRLKISEDRGAFARGCRLDQGELARAIGNAQAALQQGPDALVINKFGKTESEGGGFRPLIAEAVELGIPVLISVPWRNIDGWRVFAGDLAAEHAVEKLLMTQDVELLRQLGFSVETITEVSAGGQAGLRR